MFPEGTISLDLEPMAGKTGTARLASASGVPVTPVGLWGAQRILSKGRKPSWRTGVAESVVVGDQVRVAGGDDAYAATDRVMAAIAACVAGLLPTRSDRATATTGGGCAPDTAVLRAAVRREKSPA